MLNLEVSVQRDPGIAVRAGRGLRMYHYQKLGLPPPEHGKGHFHNPNKNYKASRAVKKQLQAAPEHGESNFLCPYPSSVVIAFSEEFLQHVPPALPDT